MNDFTDDSSVEFYLNRQTDDSTNGHEDDDTIKAKISFGEGDTPQKARYLFFNLDRFTSPPIRFPLQVVIYAKDLPEDMQSHPKKRLCTSSTLLPTPLHLPV